MSHIELDDEQRALLAGFVEESLEMLDEVEPLLIELEKNSDESGEVDPEVLNTIFRLFHSMKGSAGFLDLITVNGVTHVAETLLDMFRKGVASILGGHIDLLNRTCDFIRKLLGNIEANLTDSGFEDEAKVIICDLKETITDISGEKAEDNQLAETQQVSEPSEASPVEQVGVSDELSGESDSEQEQPVLKLTITEEMVKQFTVESYELLESAEGELLELEKEPENPDHISQVFRYMHSFKGNAGFLGYKDLEKLSHHAETVLDRLRDGSSTAPAELFTLLLEIIDFLKGGVDSLANGIEPNISCMPGLISLLDDAAAKIKSSGKKPAVRDEKATTPTNTEPEIEIPVSENTPKEPDKPVVNQKSGNVVPKSKNSTPSLATRQSVRVDVEKLDKLLDLVGELVISEAMVAQNPDLKDLEISLDRFEKSVMQLDKITRDLQDVATSIRMIPLSGTFRKMIRLVRDLSQKAGKKVELEITGEETEVDKTVIEQITDPLVHIIRNSIDHGIDSAEERAELEKPETGSILLEAKYVGGEVWITVKDDGRGLNRDKILSKAIERGIVTGDGSDLRDEDVWALIFQPGFSTADQITDISGRGVGMDVVRRNIENIRGKVDVQSELGKGTSVILRIPLTLAIIDGMIIRVGDTLYTIPIVSIRESFRPDEKAITQQMDGKEIINIRDRLYPVVRVHELFDVDAEQHELSEGTVLLVENEGMAVCLFVDEIIGQQQVVIKGLSDFVGKLKGVSGCTILGDGSVCLILDVAGLIEQSILDSKKSIAVA